MSQVILVNSEDEPYGVMDKMEAHEKGVLHRAFSIFIFNAEGDMLLQQRADGKYHSAGLWTNACCSHPLPGEDTHVAAHRRLQEELGFDTALTEIFSFTYKAIFGNGLTEHEFDHVYLGEYHGDILPNKDEVKAHEFVPIKKLRTDILINSHQYTSWFKIAFPKMEEYLAANKVKGER